MKVRHLIRTYVPTFCWQTSMEIMTMLEGVEEDIELHVLQATLSQMKARGMIEMAPYAWAQQAGCRSRASARLGVTLSRNTRWQSRACPRPTSGRRATSQATKPEGRSFP